MSWDADLTCDACGHAIVEQNYTHNTNGMINVALDRDEHWLDALNGATGPEGARLLDGIIKELESDPPRFRAMNPPNGWGSYDSVLPLLRKMRDAVGEVPATWRVCQ